MGRKQFGLATTALVGTLAAVVMVLIINNSSKSTLLQNPFFGYKMVASPNGLMKGMPLRGQLARERMYEMQGHRVFKSASLSGEENVDQTAFPSESAEAVEEPTAEVEIADPENAEATESEEDEKAEAEKEDPLADNFVDVSELDGNDEPEEPGNKLGDEVIDLPKSSEQNDLGDFYVSGKDVEKNKYFFKQRGARASVLYNAADAFNVASHKPPCKFQCIDDPWGPGCDGHGALSNGDCEEVIDANGDRFIPVEKMAPATYDSFSGNTHGLFRGQKGQALLSRQVYNLSSEKWCFRFMRVVNAH